MYTQKVRRLFLARGAALSLLGGLPRLSVAQAGLDGLRIVIGYAPGGVVDIIARKLAERLSVRTARPVIVENKPGAAGRLAVEAVKSASLETPSVILSPSSIFTQYPSVFKDLRYDVFTDFVPLATVGSIEFSLVAGPSVPESVTTVAQFADWCKANPEKANVGNPGAGSFPHFMVMLLARELKANLTHVPFKGGGAAMLAAASGHVSATLSTSTTAIALVQSGKLRVLATTAVDRSDAFPKAANFRAAGLDLLSQSERVVVLMSTKASAATQTGVGSATQAALTEPDLLDTWRKLAVGTRFANGPDNLVALRQEHDLWAPILKASGFTPEA